MANDQINQQLKEKKDTSRKTLNILIFILVILVFASIWFFLHYLYFGKTSQIAKVTFSLSPTPTGSPSPKISPTISPGVISPTPEEKTVEDVHCLQNPQKSNQIVVDSPSGYSTQSSNNLTIQGTANVFEGEFQYRLKDCRGPVLDEGGIIIAGDVETNPYFTKTLSVSLSRSPMDVILELYEISPVDGSETNLTQLPLRLTNM